MRLPSPVIMTASSGHRLQAARVPSPQARVMRSARAGCGNQLPRLRTRSGWKRVTSSIGQGQHQCRPGLEIAVERPAEAANDCDLVWPICTTPLRLPATRRQHDGRDHPAP